MNSLHIKLAIQNLKYRKKEYLLFFLTSFFTVVLLYSIFSLIDSEVLAQLTEHMSRLNLFVYLLAFITVIASCFIFTYIINFMIDCRKNEFAIYLLLGMKQKQISIIFILENILLSFISLFLGVLVGILFSSVLIKLIYILFNKQIDIIFNFSIKSIIAIFLIMLIIFFVSISKAVFSIIKSNLVDLIEDENKIEFNKYKNKKRKKDFIYIKFFISTICFIIGITILYFALKISNNTAIIMIIISIIFNSIAIYYFNYFIFSFIISKLEKNEKWKYNKENLFLFGQITSKFNFYRKRISIISLILSFSSILLLCGLIFCFGYKVNVNADSPYDVAILFDKKVKNFNDVIEFIDRDYDIKDSVMFYLYKDNNYNTPFIKLSDYNNLRKQLNLDEKEIKNNEFIIHCDWFLTDYAKNKLNQNNTISIDNNILYGNSENIFNDNMEQYRFMGEKGYVVVIPDYLTEFLTTNKSRLAISLNDDGKEELKEDLNKFIREEWKPSFEKETNADNKIGLYISVKAWSINNSLISFVSISILCLYICIIFIIFSLTFISFEQLSSSLNSKKSYNILENIGVSLKDRNILIKREIKYTFLSIGIFPIIYAILVSISAYIKYKEYLLSPMIIPYSFIITISIFLIIFIAYFILTLKISKNIITDNKKDKTTI